MSKKAEEIISKGITIPDSYHVKLCKHMADQDSAKSSLGSFILFYESEMRALEKAYREGVDRLNEKKNRFVSQVQEKENEFKTVFTTIRDIFIPEEETRDDYKYVSEVKKFVNSKGVTREELDEVMALARGSNLCQSNQNGKQDT